MGKGLPRSTGRGGPLRQEIIRQTIAVRDVEVTVDATGAAIGFGSAVIGDLPEGNVLFLGAVAYMQFSGSGADANLTADWEGDFGIGTTPAGDATITNGDVDVIQSTALAAATDEVGPRTRGTSLAADCGEIHDNTDGSLELNLNVLVDAADITDDESVVLTANGELQLTYIMLLDD
jgi:hypothetical protein